VYSGWLLLPDVINSTNAAGVPVLGTESKASHPSLQLPAIQMQGSGCRVDTIAASHLGCR
jgi:hypothetical protein